MASTTDILFDAQRRMADASHWLRRNPVSAAGAAGFAALIAAIVAFGVPSGSGEAVADASAASATTGVAPAEIAGECREQVWPNFSRNCVTRPDVRTRSVRVLAMDRDSPRVYAADQIPKAALADAKAVARAQAAANPAPPKRTTTAVRLPAPAAPARVTAADPAATAQADDAVASAPAEAARARRASTARAAQDGREFVVPSSDGNGSRRIVVRRADRYDRYDRLGF